MKAARLCLCLAAILLAGCTSPNRTPEGPLWKRDGGIFNPWG